MDKITNIRLTDCKDSLYIRPMRMHYEQNGQRKYWDLLRSHDSVGVVIYNITRQILIFVKQFRPAVYMTQVEVENCSDFIDTDKYPLDKGMAIELCAGIIDKNQTVAETIREEILEECGYDVPLSSLRKVTSYRSGVGITGALQTLFYAEVTDDMRVTKGGGLAKEGEFIDVIELSFDDAQKLIHDESVARPASLLFGLTWFFECRNKDNLL